MAVSFFFGGYCLLWDFPVGSRSKQGMRIEKKKLYFSSLLIRGG